MSDLLSRFLAACDACGLVADGPVVVAVSGGADSMALWELCSRARRWPLVVYHLDHGLREDAHRDAALIRFRAEAMEAAGMEPLAVVCEKADVAALAARWQVSIEAAGRRHRYARLEAVARRHHARVVLTAHHGDDQAETVLFNLLRGAGPVGQAGIPPRRPLAAGIALVRPLLDMRHAELLAHLVACGWSWCEDATNADVRFTRNWLRAAVLPALEQGVPGFTGELLRFSSAQRQVVAGEDEQVEALWRQALGPDDLQVMAIAHQPERLRLALWRRLLTHLLLPMARRHLRRLDDLMRGDPGRRMHLGRWFLVRRERAIAWELVATAGNLPQVPIPGPGEYHRGHAHLTVWSDVTPSDLRMPPDQACLAEGACRFPLVWRAPRRAERWSALGAPGSQTVLRWLANRGMTPVLRRSCTVLADAEGVVWIPGQTIAERCRVRLDTRQVVRLALEDTAAVRD